MDFSLPSLTTGRYLWLLCNTVYRITMPTIWKTHEKTMHIIIMSAEVHIVSPRFLGKKNSKGLDKMWQIQYEFWCLAGVKHQFPGKVGYSLLLGLPPVRMFFSHLNHPARKTKSQVASKWQSKEKPGKNVATDRCLSSSSQLSTSRTVDNPEVFCLMGYSWIIIRFPNLSTKMCVCNLHY